MTVPLTTARNPRLLDALGGPRWAAALGALVLAGIAAGYPPAIGLVVGLAVAVPLERRYRRHEGGLARPELRADLLHWLLTGTLRTACIGAALVVCWVVARPFVNPATQAWLDSLPRWAYVGLALVGIQLCYYAEHRTAHHWGFLWRFHSVHHAPRKLDWLAAAHLHPVEAFIGGFFLLPLVLVGFGPVGFGVAGALFGINDILIHANVRWRLPRLSRWIPTPEYHHWHHSNEPGTRDRNFSWPWVDRLFGTFYLPDDKRPTVYGIDEDQPTTYWAQMAHPFRRRGAETTSVPS